MTCSDRHRWVASSDRAATTSVHRVVPDGGTRKPPLFEAFPDPVLVYTDAGDSTVVRAVNPAFEATFDVTEDVAGGVALAEVLAETVVLDSGLPTADVSPTATEETAAAGAASDESDASVPSETARTVLERLRADSDSPVYVRPRSDETPRHFRLRVVPLGGGRGVLVFTDVTRLYNRASEEAASVERLEGFASVAAHDIRNPLEVAKIRLEAARDTGEDVHFEKLEGALDRIDRIVRDTLSIGPASEESTETVALADVADAAWTTVDTAGATIDVESDLPTVRGIPDRLQRLFENLFRNSIEHAGRDVAVTVGRCPAGFYVSDDGPGIPADAREHVFDPGYSTTDGSTGLGLAIVEQIAMEHGWDVALADATGGARFEFSGLTPVSTTD